MLSVWISVYERKNLLARSTLIVIVLVVLLMCCLPKQVVAAEYMEVWPFVLTTRTFRVRIPAPKPDPEILTLEVRIRSKETREVRTVRTKAVWEDVRWPKEIWQKSAMPVDTEPRGGWIAEIPIEPTKPGQYRVTAELIAPAEMKGRRFRDPDVILYSQPDWLATKAGLKGLDTLPEPWTPMEVEQIAGALVLSCWNRRTRLSDTEALIEQITSGEENILAAPLQLLIEDANGLPLKPQGEWQITQENEVKVTARRILAARGSRAQITLTQEYDGFTWINIDLDSGPGIGELEIRIPFRAEVAKYIYYFPDYPWYWGNIKNVIPAPRPSLGWTCSYRRWFFLGSMSSGLFWWCESKDKWQDPDQPNTVEVLSQSDKVEVRLHVLKGGQPVYKQSYEFGFQATPVKPWPKDPLHNKVSTFNWSSGGVLGSIDNLKQAGYEVIHVGEWWTTAWGGMTPRDPEGLRGLVEEAHKRDMAVIVYLGYEIDDSHEAFRKYPWEVLGGDPRLRSFREYRFYRPARFNPNLPARKVYANDRSGPEMERLLAGMKKLLTEYHVDGFYLDGTQMPAGGTGSLQRARELMKRMRYLVDTYGTRGVIYAHTSAFNIIPVNGFGDVIYNGEQLRAVRELHNRETVAGVLPQDYLFLLMNGRPWGVPHDLCAGRPEYVDLARLLGTGTNCYQAGESGLPIRKVWLDADLWHADYTPPDIAISRWAERPDDLHLSYYLSKGGLYTVIVYNAQASEVKVQLPICSVLNLNQQQKLSEPEVVYSESEVEWTAIEQGWQGVVPSCRAVILQARLMEG